MFFDATKFKEDVSSWNMGKAVHLDKMFKGTISLTSPLVFQDLSSAKNMHAMFW